MRRGIFILAILGAAFAVSSCSNSPNRSVSDAPNQSQVGSDGRIKTRGSAEDRKRIEYFNSIQHK